MVEASAPCKSLRMTSGNGNGGAKADWSTARVAAAERFARATVAAIDICDETRAPLSQLQKTALIEAALLEFDGLEAQLASLASIDELLHALMSVRSRARTIPNIQDGSDRTSGE
jgi:hypothetical protein